jgi:hypothetical protein
MSTEAHRSMNVREMVCPCLGNHRCPLIMGIGGMEDLIFMLQSPGRKSGLGWKGDGSSKTRVIVSVRHTSIMVLYLAHRKVSSQ